MNPNAALIIQTCQSDWDAHKDDCSGFAKAVATALGVTITGLADDIYGEIQGPDWTPIPDGPSAKEKADDGWFVLAALTGAQHVPPQSHGHVAVVVSGPLDPTHNQYPTGYWGQLGGVGMEDTPLNYAWNNASIGSVIYAGMSTFPGAPQNLTVSVNGTEIPTAAAYLQAGSSYAWVRPITDALGAEILGFDGQTVTVSLSGTQVGLGAHLENNEAFVRLGDLRKLPGVQVDFDGGSMTVAITTTAGTGS